MAVVIDGTNGISTPDLESAGPVTGTTATFSGNITLGSSVLATPTGTAPAYLCRAWVNFNGTGTVAIRASGNVSSITDNGTGDYTVNFTTAMPDLNFAVNGSTGSSGTGSSASAAVRITAPTVDSSVRISTNQVSGTVPNTVSALADFLFVSVAVFR